MPLSSAPDFTTLLWRIVTFTGDRTLLLSDEFSYLISEDAAGQTVTIPPNSDVDFAVGMQMSFKQGDTGVITFAPGAGVTIESRGGLLDTNGEFAIISIVQDSADVWSLFGDSA